MQVYALVLADSPHEGGNEQPHADAVDKHHPQKQLQGLHEPHVQHEPKAHGGHCSRGAEKSSTKPAPTQGLDTLPFQINH